MLFVLIAYFALKPVPGLHFRDIGRIYAAETAVAVSPSSFRSDKKIQIFYGKVSDTVGPYYTGNLIELISVCDEIIPRIYVRSVIAWVSERRCRRSDMYLRSAALSEKAYYSRYSRAAYDRVVNKHNALAPYSVPEDVKLNSDLVFSVLLARRDERSSDVFILNETDAVRDT